MKLVKYIARYGSLKLKLFKYKADLMENLNETKTNPFGQLRATFSQIVIMIYTVEHRKNLEQKQKWQLVN